MRSLYIFGLMLYLSHCYAQQIEVTTKKSSFTISGFGDIYFGKHWGNYNKKEPFFYNHKVNNKLRTNLLLLKGEFASPRVHMTLGLMTGDYSQYNLAAEPNWAKPLNEAFVGFNFLNTKIFGGMRAYIVHLLA